MFRRVEATRPLPSLADCFGVRGPRRVARDLATVLRHLLKGDRFALDLGTAALFRPDLSLPAYAGVAPIDGFSPIFNLFDRSGGGLGYRNSVTRARARDYRGGRLSYDEHDGTDLVCPPGTPVVCAAPGVVVAVRENWLRGGLTACVDHGSGVVTQYTHLSAMVAEVGEPLARGAVVAWSGMSGLDMVSGFPWVPPHIHFMVWVAGRPVDPFLAPSEAPRAGTWLHGNEPRTAKGPLPDDGRPPTLSDIAVDHSALDALIERCGDASIRAELGRASAGAERLAICEDSLHHERYAWPADASRRPLRPESDPSRVRLTLPLPAEIYRAARPADLW